MSTENLGAATLFTALMILGACTYNPPPEVTLEPPEAGVFTSGDPLVLSFSEPIDPGTLKITIWPDDRDIEGVLPPGTESLLATCAPGEMCGSTTLSVTDDGLSAVVQLDPDDLGQPDVPLLLEVQPGLSDLEQNTTGTNFVFDFQFQPAPIENAGPIEFDEGYYIIVSVIEDPLPAVLTLAAHIVAQDDGTFAIAAGEMDPIENAAKNTSNPDELIVDTGEQGFAIFVLGLLTVTEDGERFLESEPYDLSLALGPVELVLGDLRLSGKLEKDPDTGKDQISGTLSYAGLTLLTGDSSFDYDPGTTTFTADFVPADKTPANAPDMCGEICGGVTAQCNPPANFPPEGFCE